MLTDIRHSVRGLRHAPGVSLTAVCALALAVAASVTAFAVVDAVLIRPLPITDAKRVVVIWPRERTNSTIGEISYATYQSWTREVLTLQPLAAVGSTTWSLVLREGEPATIPVAAVSASFFELTGVGAALGRTFVPADDARGAERVALIGYGSWLRRFGGDPAIVGRSLRFQDASYTIVGVLPERFDYPRGAELWVPLVPQLEDAGKKWSTDVLGEPEFGMLFLLGRMAPSATIARARAELSTLIARDAGTAFRPGMEAILTPLDEHIFGSTRPALIAIGLCVGLVLLIACANVSLLLLVRGSAHARDTATRLALGATRWRITWQSLVDAAVLTGAGGLIGATLGFWAIGVLAQLVPIDVPGLAAVRVDARVLGFAAIACLAATVLVGIAPALQAVRHRATPAAGHGRVRGAGSHQFRRLVVVAQTSLALVLLVCVGLVTRSFVNLLRIDTGFDLDRVLTANIELPGASADRHTVYYTQLLERLRALPGVVAAGAVYQRPLEYAGVGMDGTVLIEGQRTELQFRDWEQNPRVNLEAVTPGYFEAMGVRLVRGRAFADTDTASTPRVVVVGERLARRLWPGQDPLGRRVQGPGILPDAQGQPLWASVVGVVRDGRYRGLADPRYDLYLPYLQSPDLTVKHVMVRTVADPLGVAGLIRAVARQLDPTVLVENTAPMASFVRRATAPWRFSASLLGLLGALGVALAGLGIYAAVSQSVVERTAEIGVRVAVGAMPRQIVRLVIREGVRMAAAGIAIGLAAAAGTWRVLSSLLFEVGPGDPLTLAGAAAFFLAVSLGALALPAWHAGRLEPHVALRRQ